MHSHQGPPVPSQLLLVEDDPASNTQPTNEGGDIPGLPGTGRNTKSQAQMASFFIEDNIELMPGTMLTPALRFDHHSKVGSNWSPSLNLSHALTDTFTVKAGIARAYKAPNLYQLNPDYLLYSRGQGCYGQTTSCYLQGSENLDAETSVNKELGIEYRSNGWVAARAPLDPTQQTLWGHSYGGLAVLQALFTRPTEFTTYAAASPSLWWHDGAITREAAQLPQRLGDHRASLVLMRGGSEPSHPGGSSKGDVEGPARQLAAQLRQVPGLQVSFKRFDNLQHGPMLPASLDWLMETLYGEKDASLPVAR